MIYFDNAATTFPKPRSVYLAVNECLRKYCANAARSSHRLAALTGEKIYESREAVARLLNVDNPEGVVFTYNATYAINLAIKSFVTSKCHLIISELEHNSVIRPLEKLKRTLGVEYSSFSADGDVAKNIEEKIRADTVGIISTLTSNVTGQKIDIRALSAVSKKHGLFLILDASQALGHHKINLKDTPADALCAPGHKGLFGIQGSGFAYFSDPKRKESLIEGGSGSESKNPNMPIMLPEGYEAGTLATPAIVSLSRGIEFIEAVGISEIEEHLNVLTKRLKERLVAIRGVRLYPSESGVVSFNLFNTPSQTVASELDRLDICTRAGLHCAPSAHKKLGTLDSGTVRLSLSYFNKPREIDKFYLAMKCVAKDFCLS